LSPLRNGEQNVTQKKGGHGRDGSRGRKKERKNKSEKPRERGFSSAKRVIFPLRPKRIFKSRERKEKRDAREVTEGGTKGRGDPRKKEGRRGVQRVEAIKKQNQDRLPLKYLVRKKWEGEAGTLRMGGRKN